MTLPHQTGLVREVSPRPDSVEAAEAHAHGRGYWSPGRIEWTPRNLISLVLVVLGGVAAVVSEGDEQRAVDLICGRHRQLLIDSGFLEATGTAVRRALLELSPVLMWEAEPDGDYFLVGPLVVLPASRRSGDSG